MYQQICSFSFPEDDGWLLLASLSQLVFLQHPQRVPGGRCVLRGQERPGDFVGRFVRGRAGHGGRQLAGQQGHIHAAEMRCLQRGFRRKDQGKELSVGQGV